MTWQPLSPTVIAAAITSQKDKARLPTHIQLNSAGSGLVRDSIVLLEQIRTIDKRRLKEHMGQLDDSSMRRVDEALQISFGLAVRSEKRVRTKRRSAGQHKPGALQL